MKPAIRNAIRDSCVEIFAGSREVTPFRRRIGTCCYQQAPGMLKTEEMRSVAPVLFSVSQAHRSQFSKATGIRLCARSELLFRNRKTNRYLHLSFRNLFQQICQRSERIFARWLYTTISDAASGSSVSCSFQPLPPSVPFLSV